jgi:hypothetical protein
MHPDMQRVPRVQAFFEFVVSEIKAFRLVLAGRPEQPTKILNSAGARAGTGMVSEAGRSNARGVDRTTYGPRPRRRTTGVSRVASQLILKRANLRPTRAG